MYMYCNHCKQESEALKPTWHLCLGHGKTYTCPRCKAKTRKPCLYLKKDGKPSQFLYNGAIVPWDLFKGLSDIVKRGDAVAVDAEFNLPNLSPYHTNCETKHIKAMAALYNDKMVNRHKENAQQIVPEIEIGKIWDSLWCLANLYQEGKI